MCPSPSLCQSPIHEGHVVILAKALKFSYSLVYINEIGREKEKKTRCKTEREEASRKAGKVRKTRRDKKTLKRNNLPSSSVSLRRIGRVGWGFRSGEGKRKERSAKVLGKVSENINQTTP